ncbi:hypothetical protein WA026_017692 [Henosepilachna vigintioctopunctata]|uniref:Uncharacterized protein n=1 Tax=Henosepilachna vigintioctopunctata TaxID=420089 RepID=A0AAW1U490_9CUCU
MSGRKKEEVAEADDLVKKKKIEKEEHLTLKEIRVATNMVVEMTQHRNVSTEYKKLEKWGIFQRQYDSVPDSDFKYQRSFANRRSLYK